ncbi:MAG TPA: hypothetical protein VHE35_25840, partial [Kofleriaceae bacterium]|nr:hypothetical protein [Kofleriaceae bacterium]
MTTRDRDRGQAAGDDGDGAAGLDDLDDLDGLGDFGAWLRSELTPVATTSARAAAIRERAHAELR